MTPHPLLAALLLILCLIVAVALAAAGRALILAATHRGRHEQREQAAEAEASAFVAELRGLPAPGKDYISDRNVVLPWTPQIWKAPRQLTEAEMDEIRERFLAAQGGPVEVLDDEDDLYDICAGCRGHDHCDGAVETCCCPCGWDEDWAEEHDEPAFAPDEDAFVSALLSLPVEDIDLAFSTGQFPAVIA